MRSKKEMLAGAALALATQGCEAPAPAARVTAAPAPPVAAPTATAATQERTAGRRAEWPHPTASPSPALVRRGEDGQWRVHPLTGRAAIPWEGPPPTAASGSLEAKPPESAQQEPQPTKQKLWRPTRAAPRWREEDEPPRVRPEEMQP